MKKQYFVYILASKRNDTLYVGMTDTLSRRLEEHRTETIQSFTQKYHVHTLVYYEAYDSRKKRSKGRKILIPGNVHGNCGLVKRLIQNGVTFQMKYN